MVTTGEGSMTIDYDGAIAWVSGAGSGIGRSLCGALAERGATVVAADIDHDGVEATAAAHPDSVLARRVDVTDFNAVAASIRGTAADLGQLDLVFNNAGITGPAGEYRFVQAHHWNAVLDVNLRGVINGVTAAYPIMIGQGAGHIVNTASAAGLAPTPGAVAYSTTKHAVVGLSRSLRAEASVYGIGVTVLCPGALDTPILDIEPPDDFKDSAGFWQPDGRRLFKRTTGIKDPDDFAAYALDRIATNVEVVIYGRRTRAITTVARLAPRLTGRLTGLSFGSERRRHLGR